MNIYEDTVERGMYTLNCVAKFPITILLTNINK